MKSQIKNIIENRVQRNQDNIKFYERVKALIESVEGKAINRRTFSEKRLNGLRYAERAGSIYITDENDERSIQIHSRMSDDKIVSLAKFEKSSTMYSSASEKRIEQLESKDLDSVTETFSKVQAHYEGLKKAFAEISDKKFDSYNFPIMHEILNHIERDTKDRDKCLRNFQFIK